MQNTLHIGTLGKPHGIKGAISIYSKTQPSDLIFTQDLYLKNGQAFTISKYESHHSKTVLFSPLIEDRTSAEKWNRVELYCDKNNFFAQYPDQIFDDLCQGYQVFDKTNKLIGILEEVTIMSEIPMMVVRDKTTILHLGLKISELDHHSQSIRLEYTCHDH